MKFIKAALIAGSLVVTSSTFADISSKSHLSAFAGIPTEAVSKVDLDAASGKGFWTTIKKIFKGASNMKNGSCKWPKC